jgi:hypothetical protein
LGLEKRTHDACNATATRIECKHSMLNSRYSDSERGDVQDLADDKYSGTCAEPVRARYVPCFHAWNAGAVPYLPQG